MLLTIGMIVKNEEKYLRRCLEAISPILSQVDSELIIADTGSADSTVEIARAFTSNVFHFEWCDDFAAARNSTLEKSTGKWYMYIDADEIINDCAEIISFFNSGEYKNFNTATVSISSSNKESMDTGATFIAARLVKKTKGLRFVGAIHEMLIPATTPTKNLGTTVAHYGYITENNEERIAQKAQRNLKILLAEEKRKPEDCGTLFNICQSYLIADDYAPALESCEKGLKCAIEQNDHYKYSFYALKVIIHQKTNRFSEVLPIINEYFSCKNEILGTDIEMYIFKALYHLELKEYKEAIEAYKNYMRLYPEYKNGLHRTLDVFHHAINYTEPIFHRESVYNLVELLSLENDYEQAYEYSRLIDLIEYQDDGAYLVRSLKQTIEIMMNRKDFSYLPGLYYKLEERNRKALQEIIEMTASRHELREKLSKAFYESDAEGDYNQLMRLRYLFCTGTLTGQAVESALNKIEQLNPMYADLIFFVLYYELPIELLTEKIDASDLPSYFINNLSLYYKHWTSYLQNTHYSDSSRPGVDLWLALLLEQALIAVEDGNELKKELFKEYASHYMLYLKSVFKESVITEENAYLLPKPLRLGCLCGFAENYRQAGQTAKYVGCLRRILKLSPRLSDLIKMLLDEIKEPEKKTAPTQEIDKYARIIKNNILSLLEEGDNQKALNIIASYEQLCPDDDEMKALKKRLENN